MLIDLPIIICGQKIINDGTRNSLIIKLENGVEVRLPELTEEDINRIIDSRFKTGLHETHIDDITIFFQKISQNWKQKDNPLRDEAIRYCSLVTGYPPYLILRDYLLLNQLYGTRGELYDQLDAELGDFWLLEEWIPKQGCYLHVQPRGLVTTVLVGNIPIAAPFGMFRSLVVKNNTLCKLPKRDPISALYFGLSFVELEPDHPVTKSLSIVYWEKDSWQEERLLSASNAVCIWGGEKAINEIKKKIKAGAKILEYGPKRSLSLVDLTQIDPTDTMEDIGYRIAHDFSLYNQEACFASQELYLVADDAVSQDFLTNLQKGLNHYLEKFPKGEVLNDNKAHVLITRNEQLIAGSEVISTDNHDWTIIVSKEGKRLPNHPLCRTIMIHRIEKLEDALDYIDSFTQTIALYPWSAWRRLNEKITLNGADRIVAIGMTGSPRTGFPHDSILTYNELVRWVNVERDVDYNGKYYSSSKQAFIQGVYKTIWEYWK